MASPAAAGLTNIEVEARASTTAFHAEHAQQFAHEYSAEHAMDNPNPTLIVDIQEHFNEIQSCSALRRIFTGANLQRTTFINRRCQLSKYLLSWGGYR